MCGRDSGCVRRPRVRKPSRDLVENVERETRPFGYVALLTNIVTNNKKVHPFNLAIGNMNTKRITVFALRPSSLFITQMTPKLRKLNSMLLPDFQYFTDCVKQSDGVDRWFSTCTQLRLSLRKYFKHRGGTPRLPPNREPLPANYYYVPSSGVLCLNAVTRDFLQKMTNHVDSFFCRDEVGGRSLRMETVPGLAVMDYLRQPPRRKEMALDTTSVPDEYSSERMTVQCRVPTEENIVKRMKRCVQTEENIVKRMKRCVVVLERLEL